MIILGLDRISINGSVYNNIMPIVLAEIVNSDVYEDVFGNYNFNLFFLNGFALCVDQNGINNYTVRFFHKATRRNCLQDVFPSVPLSDDKTMMTVSNLDFIIAFLDKMAFYKLSTVKTGNKVYKILPKSSELIQEYLSHG